MRLLSPMSVHQLESRSLRISHLSLTLQRIEYHVNANEEEYLINRKEFGISLQNDHTNILGWVKKVSRGLESAAKVFNGKHLRTSKRPHSFTPSA
jgi:hypothetical protein